RRSSSSPQLNELPEASCIFSNENAGGKSSGLGGADGAAAFKNGAFLPFLLLSLPINVAHVLPVNLRRKKVNKRFKSNTSARLGPVGINPWFFFVGHVPQAPRGILTIILVDIVQRFSVGKINLIHVKIGYNGYRLRAELLK